MGTSSRIALLALAAALAVAGCGGAAQQPGSFAWLHPASPPAGWNVAQLPSGTASLAYPASWRRIVTDPGTVSMALMGSDHRIHGYLNATPRSGGETLADWDRFRPAHNHEEGDRAVVTEAAASGVRFRGGTGSCVVDRYATISAHYREIACLVRGTHGTTVVVAAAQPQDWARLQPDLRRAVASFAT